MDLIAWFGFATVAVSLLGIVVQVVLRLSFPDIAPSGISTVIVLILFLGGVQILAISVIGSYLAHMYEEVKRRPAYIVESILNRRSPPQPAAITRRMDGPGTADERGPHFIEADRPARAEFTASLVRNLRATSPLSHWERVRVRAGETT